MIMNANVDHLYLAGKTVFLTGATGFIGSHLLKRLISEGCDVHISIRKNSSLLRIEDVKEKCTSHIMDLNDFENVKSTLKQIKPEIVYHIAAYGVDYREQDVHQAIATNIVATINLFDAFRENNGLRFIHTGSCVEYGHKNTPISESDLPDPSDTYGATKMSSVYLLSGIAKRMEFGNLIILRPFGIFGEFEGLHKFFPQLIEKLLNGQPIQMTAGEQIRDYIYVDDLIDGYIAASVAPMYNTTEIINIGSGTGTSLKDLALLVSKQLGVSSSLLKFKSLPYRPDEMMYLVANIDKAKALLGWAPKTPKDKGLEKTINWYKINIETLYPTNK